MNAKERIIARQIAVCANSQLIFSLSLSLSLSRYNDEIASEMNFHLRFYSRVHHFIACRFDKMYFCVNKTLNRCEERALWFFIWIKDFLCFRFRCYSCAHTFECVCFAWEWKSNTKQNERNERTNEQTKEWINKKDEQQSSAEADAVVMLPINTLQEYFYCKQLNGMNF